MDGVATAPPVSWYRVSLPGIEGATRAGHTPEHIP